MTRLLTPYILCAAILLGGTNCLAQPGNNNVAAPITVMLRFDDIGMCHALNTAIDEIAGTGLPMSASVMFACPWYQEAVTVLKRHPNVSVGVHLTLNSEWKNYRWGPVAGAGSVPSLVDSNGYFFPSRAALFAHNPRVEEIERELRSQLDRAVHSGLRIDYVDYHMGAAVQTLELRSLVERLAAEYHVGISRYFGERDTGNVYSAPFESKTDTLVKVTEGLIPGVRWLLVFHIGLETPEMDALVDMNSFGLPNVSKYRNAERKAVLSERFQNVLRKRNIQLRSYYDVIGEEGLEKMKRPPVEQ